MLPCLRIFLPLFASALAFVTIATGQQPESAAKPAPIEPPPLAKYPEPDAVHTAMKNAAAFFRSNLSVAGGYTKNYTLNDNNLQNVMQLLLEAHDLHQADTRYLEAAKRLGDFLLLAQMPEPQPVWAQQYDSNMHPAWARKFEPPSVCSIESLGAMRALHELWLVTGNDKFIATLPAALHWFERSRLKDKDEPTWARFYELETNQPLYCKAETYEVTYEDSDLPTHYGFQVSGSFARPLEKLRNAVSQSRDEQIAHRQRDKSRLSPTTEKAWSDRARKLASTARNALKEQQKQGYWKKGDLIDAGEFVKHMRALTEYLAAAENGADTFDAVRLKDADESPAN